jgi:3-hydroxymyristoyl/3-hydroxydecanoyl-(acyl carrier protein) dehydratase
VPEQEYRFDDAHPTAAGHFPGNPIIPGAVLLDAVLSTIAATGGTPATHCEIKSVKFLLPVRPGDRIVIRWHETPSGETRFECIVPASATRDPGRIILKGSMHFSGRTR